VALRSKPLPYYEFTGTIALLTDSPFLIRKIPVEK
jgi:hypothetical protein